MVEKIPAGDGASQTKQIGCSATRVVDAQGRPRRLSYGALCLALGHGMKRHSALRLLRTKLSLLYASSKMALGDESRVTSSTSTSSTGTSTWSTLAIPSATSLDLLKTISLVWIGAALRSAWMPPSFGRDSTGCQRRVFSNCWTLRERAWNETRSKGCEAHMGVSCLPNCA
jgi:hypothetical protein